MSYRSGIFYWFGYVLPVKERLKMIKEAGFDGVSIWWEDEKAFDREKKEEIPTLVRSTGLYLENIHLPYHLSNDLWSVDREVRERVLEVYRGWLYDASFFEVPIVVIHMSEGPTLPGPLSTGFSSLEELLDVAESLGLLLAVENTRCTEYLGDLFREMGGDHLGLCYDSSHDQLEGERGEILEDFAPYILTTHLSDNGGEEDNHWLPGEGMVDWEKTMSSLKENQYKGYLSMEVFPRDRDIGPEAFLVDAYNRIKWLAGMME